MSYCFYCANWSAFDLRLFFCFCAFQVDFTVTKGHRPNVCYNTLLIFTASLPESTRILISDEYSFICTQCTTVKVEHDVSNQEAHLLEGE